MLKKASALRENLINAERRVNNQLSGCTCDRFFYVNLYKEYSYLKLRDLEELPCFGVMIWQLCHLLRSAMNCIQITLYNAKVK